MVVGFGGSCLLVSLFLLWEVDEREDAGRGTDRPRREERILRSYLEVGV